MEGIEMGNKINLFKESDNNSFPRSQFTMGSFLRGLFFHPGSRFLDFDWIRA